MNKAALFQDKIILDMNFLDSIEIVAKFMVKYNKVK